MPVRDSRPCDSASGSSPSVNSAGSSNSVIGINSGYSNNMMEHLSSEERECLMFLEETIESLETENYGGVSNGGPARPSQYQNNKMAHLNSVRPVKPEELSVHEDPNKVLGKDHKPHKLLVPTPLVLANGNAKLLKKSDFSTIEPKPAIQISTPKSPAINSLGSPGRHEPNPYASSQLTDLPPSFIPEPPVKHGATAKDISPKIYLDPKTGQKPKSLSPDLQMELLPPPSDFMDEPVLLPPVHTLPSGQSQTQTRISAQPTSQLPLTPPPAQLSPNELDNLRKKASQKKAPEKVLLGLPNSSNFGEDTTVVDSGEPKSPPVVAPKPKKLPSSIVLKNHKEPTPVHSLVSPGDRMIVNQQKVHLEALKKLGLLKGDETNSQPHKASSPPTSFNTSPSAASYSAELTANPVLVHADHHGVAEAQGKTNFTFPSILPEKESENLLITRTQSSKPFEMKSASLERSGVGLKSLTLEKHSQLTSQEQSPENEPVSLGHLRNTRPRPSSAGNWKDLNIDPIPPESTRQPDLRRSLPVPVPLPTQPKVEPPKSLRSHGISVVISPQSNNDADRKQALKRLGLIKN
ncbi:specifically androgen-regulated gene protein isoform 1-T2 [Clarias gariepinus]|uniref:specifically androgen-regulated gene protein n=1 Tax=Clarias gariepinus TaxID=13013 RepID=UPI00234D6E5E|nr:specifically androgen-regulated gene protein [Clarias gariepinus]XP_053338898.1 specifically androgen-regulated gene protein [Clarias gariepinus]